MSFQIGEIVGDYEIVKVLGAGGMGKVYQVRNTLSDRMEAMKVLLPNLESNADLADRFLREIKVQATLQHPNIAGLHTAMRIQNQLLMLMEFVEGETLEAMLERGPLAPADVVRHIAQVLDALAYAHERGIVHRDIKPANMMLTPAGQVKLMDFGIAKLATDRRLTQTGTTVGSLFYMSPEQIRGGAFDTRSDLYSLGISIYELVTGMRPFQGDSDFQIMAAHLQQPPVPPVDRDPRIPAALSDVILMAIAKDPAERFQTAAAFRAALESTLAAPGPMAFPAAQTLIAPATQAPGAWTPEPVPEAPMKYSSKRGLYMALGSVATVAVLALAIWQAPKFLPAKANTGAPAAAAQDPQPAPQTAKPEPVANPEPPAQTPPAPVAQTPAATPVTTPPLATPNPGRTAAPAPVSPGGGQAARMAPLNAAPAATPSSQTPVETAAPVQAQTPAPVPSRPAGPDPAQMNELRKQYNLLSIRAGTAKSGVQALQGQMGGQTLRGDIREAVTRIDYLMSEAMQSLQSGDLAGARQNLQYAERAVEQVEKFLGR